MGYFAKFPKQILALSFKEVFYWKTRWPELLIRLIAPCLMVLLILIVQRTYLQQVTSGGDVLYESDFSAEIPTNLIKPKDGEKYVYFVDSDRQSNTEAETLLGIEVIRTMARINDPPLTVSQNTSQFGSWNCSEDICLISGTDGSFTQDDYKKIVDSTKLLGGWNLFLNTYSSRTSIGVYILPKYAILSGNAFLPTGSGATKPSDESNRYMLLQAIYRALSLMQANVKNDIEFTINHKKSAGPSASLGRTDAYNASQYFIASIIPFLLSIPLFLSASFVNAFVDRDRLLRVGMKMYGLYNSAYWFFVFIFQATMLAIVCALIVILGYICQLDFFILTKDPLTIFIILWSTAFYYCCLLTAMGTFIRSKVGSNLMLFLIFICNTFFTLVTFDYTYVLTPTAQPLILPYGVAMTGSGLLFFPTFGYSSAMTHIAFGTTFYKTKTGNVDAPGFTDADFWDSTIQKYYNTQRNYDQIEIAPPALCIAVVLAQALLFLLITMYLDNVVPPAFDGIRQSIFYPFSLKYWGFGWGRKVGKDDLAIDFETKSTAFEVMEDIDPDLTREYKETINSFDHDNVAISVIQLSKTFTSILKRNTNNKNALNSVSFNVKKNQITAILGHSAAGKSTLCKILTGLMATSSGDALINKVSVAKHFQHVQENIGVCMQEDFIIDDLTGKHHLYFFALLRGMPFKKLKEEAFAKLNRVFLSDSANKVTKTYSGGMKRRLSLATSMIGDPDILFLDEPTTATDIVIKRKIWNMLVDYKNTGKTIVLTTHSMEEAENIGDKVVVMALGKMRACGNIHHLKKRWAAGYRLELFFNERESPNSIENVKNVIGLKYNAKKIALAKENRNINSLTYRMNMKSTEIYQILEYLNTKFVSETNTTLKDFALSFTSLKDVFLRVTHGGSQDFEESEVVDNKYKRQVIEEEEDEQSDEDIDDTPKINKRLFNLLSQVQSEKVKLIMDKNYSFNELLKMDNLEFEIVVKSKQ